MHTVFCGAFYMFHFYGTAMHNPESIEPLTLRNKISKFYQKLRLILCYGFFPDKGIFVGQALLSYRQ